MQIASYFSLVLKKTEFPADFSKNSQYKTSQNSVQWRPLFFAVRRMDRQTDRQTVRHEEVSGYSVLCGVSYIGSFFPVLN